MLFGIIITLIGIVNLTLFTWIVILGGTEFIYLAATLGGVPLFMGARRFYQLWQIKQLSDI